jgi:serine/threonine protein kinase/TolB-like protein/tetratricopeptide (TPR) repeat protein
VNGLPDRADLEPDRRTRISELYHLALERPPAERHGFLQRVCERDEALRLEVESLLSYEVAAASFLETPAADAAARGSTEMIGRQLGPYRILAPLGAGGMGEVYRARDSKLGRDVAIKVLPSHFTADPERRSRFAREARLLATLNHPHIGAIYGLEETEGVAALVLELVEGPTLADRLARGPLPLPEALTIARQIAEALDAAHEKGIVHRDLKPANIVLQGAGDASRLPSGDSRAKVLDFGVAKTMAVGLEADLTESGSPDGTADGRILGTPAYMSPEQARGQAVDKRTDIWAFGCVLYEMLTGRLAFGGDTVSDTFVSILEREPDWAALPAQTPASIRTLLERCLRKDPQKRLHDIADARIEIDERNSASASSFPGVPRAARRRFFAGAIGAVLLAVAVGAAWRWLGPAAGGRPLPPGDVPLVAVQPFRTIGEGEPYFADGITEAVTTELGRVAGLRVMASNSTFAFRGEAESSGDFWRKHGVGLIVQGSVQRAGRTVALDVSLVDTRDGTALWSERYSREITDVLAMQGDIAAQIASQVSKRFGTTVTAKSASFAPTNPDAYDAYLRGVWHLKGRSPAAQVRTRLVAAIGELERAVDIDRDFALARAALASAYTQRSFYDAADPVFEQRAFVQIERALAINPNQAEAYLARAQLTWNLRNGFPHKAAIDDLRRALSVNPSLADAYVELGKIYYHVGLTDKAVDANEQALRLDPSALDPANRRLMSFIDAGRLQEVRNEMERNAMRYPIYIRGDALLAMEQLEEALEVLSLPRSTDTADPASSRATALLGVVYARLGRRRDAERTLAAIIPIAENLTGLSHMHHPQFHIGAALALIGRYDDAVRWLTKAADEGYPSYPRFSTDQSLAPLKGHAGFVALLERLRQDWDRWQKTL